MESPLTLRRFVLCGATGDLATGYLVPALARLHAAGHLPPGFRLIAVARHAWDTAAFRRHLHERARPETAGTDAAAVAALAARAECAQVDDNWRWTGVPFVLRTGKALGHDRHEVVVHFRPVPHVAFGDRAPAPSTLRPHLDPDRVSLSLAAKAAGDLFALDAITLDSRLVSTDLPACAWLVRDVLRGDPTLSIRDDEVEESWRIVDPVLAAWRRGDVPLEVYPAGSEGLAADGAS
jgi:glucose-6-phosphate 1-dehydrogenase